MEKEKDNLDWSKSFMYSLHQTYFLAEKRLEHKLAGAHGITFSQFLILLGIHCKKRPSQSAIADFLFLTEATVSRHIAALMRDRYITSTIDPENRRRHVLDITPLGNRAFSAAHAIIENDLKNIFDVIPRDHRAEITKAFKLVITKLKDQT